MNVRRIAPHEVDDLFVDDLATTLGHLAPVGTSDKRWLCDLVKRIVANPNHCLFVAEIDDQVVGTLTLFIEQKVIHHGGLVGHIEDVATREGWEHRGLGSALVNRAVQEARLLGCYKIVLDCGEHNVPFYERLGFRRHEVTMRLDLST